MVAGASIILRMTDWFPGTTQLPSATYQADVFHPISILLYLCIPLVIPIQCYSQKEPPPDAPLQIHLRSRPSSSCSIFRTALSEIKFPRDSERISLART